MKKKSTINTYSKVTNYTQILSMNKIFVGDKAVSVTTYYSGTRVQYTGYILMRKRKLIAQTSQIIHR